MTGYNAKLTIGPIAPPFFTAHPELESLLTAARQSAQDLPWLAIADWLMEHDEPAKAATVRAWLAIRREADNLVIRIKPSLAVFTEATARFLRGLPQLPELVEASAGRPPGRSR